MNKYLLLAAVPALTAAFSVAASAQVYPSPQVMPQIPPMDFIHPMVITPPPPGWQGPAITAPSGLPPCAYCYHPSPAESNPAQDLPRYEEMNPNTESAGEQDQIVQEPPMAGGD